MKHIFLPSVNSTNTYLKENPEAVPDMTIVAAIDQISGRGQRGNTWEAAQGQNLTFSFRFKPSGIKASEQFSISEAVALAIVDFLKGINIEVMVKWPNDIYAGNKKIAGILIENSIFGMELSSSIIGIGLNVNQKEFLSDAPNPVSMANLTNKSYNLEFLLNQIGESLSHRLAKLQNKQSRTKLHEEYLDNLWRKDGLFHKFKNPSTGELFEGIIDDVALTGELSLKRQNGRSDRFAFKEIMFVI